jgi:hypothetical protein
MNARNLGIQLHSEKSGDLVYIDVKVIATDFISANYEVIQEAFYGLAVLLESRVRSECSSLEDSGMPRLKAYTWLDLVI